jgi:hypothetical protein
VLAVALGAAILASAYARAPRRPFPRTDLRWMVFAALVLYTVGMAASLTHHGVLAAVLYAAGITVSALAAWLSRGNDSGNGPERGDEPLGEQPPPDPDGIHSVDWAAFERDFAAYAHRHRSPVTTR